MAHAYRPIEGRDKFLQLHARYGGIELESFLRGFGIDEVKLLNAGVIKDGPIHGGTNCRWRPTVKGKRYFVYHAEFEAMLLLPGKGLALLRALDKAEAQ